MIKLRLGIHFALFVMLCMCRQYYYVDANKPLQRVQVTLKGAVLYLSDVTTVEELQQRLFEETGLDEDEQGSATYQGTILDKNACLSECGICDGGQVNMIPKPMAKHWKLVKEMEKGLTKLRTKAAFSTNMSTMQRDQEEIKVLEQLLADIAMKAPMVQESLDRFVQLLQSPDGIERAKNPERIEGLRQVIINNPMLLKYVLRTASVNPGMTMQETVQDSNAWFLHVCKAVDRWATLSGNEVWQNLVTGRLFET
mmetsp:Transcript_9099/g.26025  ORF Transcript_9099/g.26025 Transcript_9099/m.26025 type:complete len:254 (+) Transcript_9099:116-877(+)